MKKDPVYDIGHFSQPIRKRDLYVNTLREHLKDHPFVEKPHRHNFYLMVLFTNGSGSHVIDFDHFEIQPGSLFLLQPGQIHSWQLSADIGGYIVFYSKEIFNVYFGNKSIEDYPFFQSVKNLPELLLDAETVTEFETYFKLMVTENLKLQYKSPDKLLNLIDTLHIEIARLYFSEALHTVHTYNHKIREFERLLEQFYATQKSPSFYASKMNITLKHLNRICKELLNETVTEIITKRIVLEAKRLLTDQSLSVTQIADRLGYDNYPYFGKLFKKYSRLTPGEFRKQL